MLSETLAKYVLRLLDDMTAVVRYCLCCCQALQQIHESSGSIGFNSISQCVDLIQRRHTTAVAELIDATSERQQGRGAALASEAEDELTESKSKIDQRLKRCTRFVRAGCVDQFDSHSKHHTATHQHSHSSSQPNTVRRVLTRAELTLN